VGSWRGVEFGIRIEVNVKSDGQECPSHTGKIKNKISVKGSGRGRPLYMDNI
jgi:hypothetical protein